MGSSIRSVIERDPHAVEAHQDSKSGSTHKGGKKKKDGVSAVKREKQRGSPTGSNPVASSQEHAKRE